MAKKTKASDVVVKIEEMNIKEFNVKIRGFDGPLVVHNWSIKAIREMLSKQMATKKATKAKVAKDPESDFQESLYWYMDGKTKCYGFPASAFKKSFIRAVKTMNDMKQLDLPMILAKQLIFISPDGREDREVTIPLEDGGTYTHCVTTDLIRIHGEPKKRMDMVRIGKGTADIRFRGEFITWTATLQISYNADVLDEPTIANLIYRAGMTVGIGEGRPEKGDQGWGRFEIV